MVDALCCVKDLFLLESTACDAKNDFWPGWRAGAVSFRSWLGAKRGTWRGIWQIGSVDSTRTARQSRDTVDREVELVERFLAFSLAADRVKILSTEDHIRLILPSQ